MTDREKVFKVIAHTALEGVALYGLWITLFMPSSNFAPVAYFAFIVACLALLGKRE